MLSLSVKNNNPPNDLTYKNGTIVEFVFENRYSIESEIQVGCENTLEFPDVCSMFEFRKNEAKSTKNRWLGSLKILKRLNYMEHSLLQLNAIAKVFKAFSKQYNRKLNINYIC